MVIGQSTARAGPARFLGAAETQDVVEIRLLSGSFANGAAQGTAGVKERTASA